jgi:uncharacterized protein YcfJ
MPTSMDTTNTWLAVMAIAIIVQTLLMFGIAIVAWRAMGQAADAVKQLEARHLAPLSARVTAVSERVTAVADDVQEVITRVRRADDAVRAQLDRLDNVAHVAGHAIGAKVWPVVGLSRAVGAAFKAFTSRGTTSPSSPGTPHVAGVPTR